MINPAAEEGFAFGDPQALGLLFAGIAIFAAIAALSHQHDRAFSASLIYLGLGGLAASAVAVLDFRWLNPIDDADLIERLCEVAVIIALFSAGLKLDRPLGGRSWAIVWRLLAIAMPLTIAAVALFGVYAMGLSTGAAIVLGALLAPTDPVLAGDVGVGPPGEEEEREPNFALTGEAGLNDGLAFPFIFLGVFIAAQGGTGWVGEWVAADVLFGILTGVVLGALGGRGIAAATIWLRKRDLLAHEYDGWYAIPAVLVIYGITELLGGYGFLAAFAGGVAARRYESPDGLDQRVHDGADVVEKFGELAIILLLGSMLTLDGLGEPGLSGWLLVPVLLLVIRPLSVLIALAFSGRHLGERLFIAWFGVRGIGSVYYAAVAVGTGALAGDTIVVVWTAFACVLASVFVHGITASPLERRLLRERQAT